ncbi:hypothetical protein ENUP19_0002G0011 [Entamoeba nuttalli]|uniref:Uncharacterized protein n=1 Tax=Entamoeba nuttalli TaxID=412467 RepID=A0ABQ0D727_9EUKA
MIEIQNQEYWKKLFEEEIKILTPQEVEEIKNTKIKEYTSSTIWRRWYFLAREKTKTNRMEEETISMTMEEENNQYNPIEINDNRIYNNYKEKKKGDVNYNITNSSETKFVNDISTNVVVDDEISSSEDDLQIKRKLIQKSIEEMNIQHKNITTFELENQKNWRSKQINKEEIEEEEVMKIIKEEEMKEQEDVQFINYYYNKKKVHQIINIINKNEIIINTLDDYYHYIKSVASTINIINKNKQERSGKKSIERILQSKICRLRDLLHNKQYMKLKRILHIKKYDIYHIKIKTNEQINYYKYLRKMKRIEIESRKNNLKRIRLNYKMMKYGKRQHLNKSKEDEYPDNISSINFLKGIYETNTIIDFI